MSKPVRKTIPAKVPVHLIERCSHLAQKRGVSFQAFMVEIMSEEVEKDTFEERVIAALQYLIEHSPSSDDPVEVVQNSPLDIEVLLLLRAIAGAPKQKAIHELMTAIGVKPWEAEYVKK